MAMDDSKKPYGDVKYADPGYKEGVKRYPIDTEAHARAAWSYINMPKNQSGYSSEELASIKGRIKAALKRFGVQVSDDSRSLEVDNSIERIFTTTWQPKLGMPVEVRASKNGREIGGYAAVFNRDSETSAPTSKTSRHPFSTIPEPMAGLVSSAAITMTTLSFWGLRAAARCGCRLTKRACRMWWMCPSTAPTSSSSSPAATSPILRLLSLRTKLIGDTTNSRSRPAP